MEQNDASGKKDQSKNILLSFDSAEARVVNRIIFLKVFLKVFFEDPYTIRRRTEFSTT
jgi:hypothetical protein